MRVADMLIIGLTGSIGMGKSTVAQRFRDRGIAVCDADAVVHELYGGAAAPLIEAAFPGTTAAGQVDRGKLAQALLAEPGRFQQLEAIVHPLVQAAERRFLQDRAATGAGMAVLEIPLLLETGGNRRVDFVVVVSAPAEVQSARVLARPGMTEERLSNLSSRQMSDADKRRAADFVVDTGQPLEGTLAQVDKLIESLRGRTGTAFAAYWT